MTAGRQPSLLRDGTAAAMALVTIVAAAYANSLSGPFVFDDKLAIVGNESIRRMWPPSDVLFGAQNATVIGRPLLNLSLAMNYAAGGTHVVGYHVANVVVHLIAALALFGFVRRTLLAPLAPASLSSHATGVAFSIALIWAVHPLQTESVTYVCQRAESLAGMLTLTTLYCATRGADSAHARGWTAASVAACLLAVGTKETAVAAPLLVLLHDRAFHAGTFREALRRRPGLYTGLAATWFVLAALIVSSAGRAGSAGFSSGVGALDYAATQPRAIVDYLRAAIWPSPLIFDRGALLATSAVEIVPYAAAIMALVAATAWALRSRPRLGFVGAWFFVILAPTSSFVPLATQTVAEHRMYLPLAAVATLAVLAGQGALLTPALRTVAVLGVAAALGWATHRRNETYRDELSLWCETAESAPRNDRAQVNCGACLLDAGDVAGALRRFDAAVALAPGNAIAHVYRGNALVSLGRAEDAELAFTDMLRLVPEHSAVAHDNRGVVRRALGKKDLALADFDAAIREFPGFARAYANRAQLRLDLGDRNGARSDVETCRQLGQEPPAELVARVGLEPR